VRIIGRRRALADAPTAPSSSIDGDATKPRALHSTAMSEASSSESKPARGSQLAVQDLSTLNVSELDALSPQVISRQATINIGAPPHTASGARTHFLSSEPAFRSLHFPLFSGIIFGS